ncbi:TetR/AcrR family transcriptional regulator [Nocardia mangyaensis]|uniref:TetR/AcrR family transcriptional regulator n=1 Tax=Nocardia mangyaensis TaxID=2213200 RepID=UPI000B294148|nr:TetR/AcrR family transcriptional regulator [Nocardia mangyaensis]
MAVTVTSGAPADGSTRRVTKRRAETRQRLLDAAYEVFAEVGFGRARPEQICERAGYTRGAFYSQFSSMDELFLTLWEQWSTRMLDDLRALLDSRVVAETADERELVEHVLRAVPLDDKWFRVNSEFTTHAIRHPELRALVAARERANAAAIVPVVEALLARVGRVVTDREALGQALIAVHDGTMAQCLVEPENPVVAARRVDLFLRVILSFTVRD